MAYDFNSLTKQADEASNRDKFYTDFEDVDPNKLHQISELTNWMRTKAKGSDVREIIAQLFERTWLENIKEGNANMEVSLARGSYPNLKSRLDNVDNKQKQTTAQLAEKANKDEVTNVMTPKGTSAYASLPTSGNQVGWYYYCPDGDGSHGAGNYVWNGKSWFFGGTGDEGYNLLKEDLTDVKNALVFVESSNYWNPDEVTTVTLQGTSLLQSGKVSVSEGEIYYLSQHKNSSDSLTAEPFWAVYQYDSDGNKTMSKNWLLSYTVPSGVVAVQFLNASTTYKYIMVEKDTQTLKWENYFDPYYKCVDTEARTDIDKIKEAIGGGTDNSEFVIPSAFYGVVNHEMNIYYQNIIKNVSIDSVCGFDTTSVSGVERYRDRLIWKPTAESFENGKISFYKNDWNHETKNITIPFISAPSDTGSTELKVIVIGDSKIAYGEVVRYLSNLFDSDNHTLTLLGSRYDNNDTGDMKYKHEGRSGWSSYHYTYVQSHNDVTNAFYNSNYTDPTYGTKFDFSTYMSNQGYDDVDYVFINLGTNDYGQVLSDIKWQTDAMIKSIHAFSSSIKIVIGLNEGVYRRALQHTALNEWIYTLNAAKIAKYDGKLSNVYVLPIYPSIDLYNDYPMSSVALSEGDSVYGDSKTRTYVSDPIHQNKAGFYKYAMCMYSLIKCIEGGLVS